MQFKCPKCDAEMSLSEKNEHTCMNEECGHTLSVDEATNLFEAGELVGIAEETEIEDITQVYEGEEIVVASIDEDIAALVEGEDLSEAFVEKAKTIFEAAVASRVSVEVKSLQEKAEAYAAYVREEIESELVEKVDGYLDLAVTEWISENELAIEEGLKVEMNNEFVEGLSSLFEKHFIQVPGDRWDIVEGLSTKVTTLESSVDEEIEKAIAVKKELLEANKRLALVELSEGLTETQKEKLTELAEGVTAESVDDFKAKVVTLKESYFSAETKEEIDEAVATEVVTEEEIDEVKTKVTPGAYDPMAEAIRLLNAQK